MIFGLQWMKASKNLKKKLWKRVIQEKTSFFSTAIMRSNTAKSEVAETDKGKNYDSDWKQKFKKYFYRIQKRRE